jgi:hypothetical protein
MCGPSRLMTAPYPKRRHAWERLLFEKLHAIEKDTGAVPRSDIDLAKQRMADFRRRMDAIRRTPPRGAGKDAPPASRPL